MKYEYLKKTGKIGNMTLRNRMVLPAMDTRTSSPSGAVEDSHIRYYAKRAEGGAGMIITEIVNPSPGLKGQPGELENTSEMFIPGLSRLADAIHAGGAKAVMQLCHCGMFARSYASDKPAMSPSGVPTFTLPDQIPSVMTKEEIRQVAEDFGMAAARAREGGWDGIEIHGGHGYLLSEFSSAFFNRRTDEYGGSVENRARFPLEVIASVQKHAGRDFPIIYKMPAVDLTPGGLEFEEAVAFAKMLEAAGAAAIDLTSGSIDARYREYKGIMNDEMDPKGLDVSHGVGTSSFISPYLTPHGVNLPYAKRLKEHINIPVMAVNSILPEMAEEAISKGELDFAAFGRQMIADPQLPRKIMEDRPEDIRPCMRCNECLSTIMNWRVLRCAGNPEAGHEDCEFTVLKAADKVKKVAVIGGGPAGMEAAVTAAKRGHEVTLFEKNSELGGLLYYVAKPDFKADYRAFADYMKREVSKHDVKVRLNTEFTVEMAEAFDEIICTTGSALAVPKIPGLEQSGYIDPLEVIDGKIPGGESFIVLGGGLVGCEASMCLAEAGKKVTIVDAMPDVAVGMMEFLRWCQKAKLKELGIDVRLRHKILSIQDKCVECIAGKDILTQDFMDTKVFDLGNAEIKGEKVSLKADGIVLALGMKSQKHLSEQLIDAGYNVVIAGDADKPRKIVDAVHEGYHAGRRI